MKKVLYLLLLSAFTPIILFAIGQTEEADYKQVSGKENWEYEVPIQDKEPGQYNLLIRAKDKANNKVFSEPFNIFVDPESDLPIVSITNPSSFMRVGGDLNIVGTARDDDAIEKVFIKINDGEYFEAVGKEFWSYLLSPETLEDGQHTVTAKAIDINGVEGYETTVVYNQDTNKPANSIDNYENGAIFSGKVHINGKVIDANGISKLELSTDNQRSYTSIEFSKDKEEDFYIFDMTVDTVKLEDGPNIYWYKSVDKTGSVGYTAFLFFVDNIGPEITIIDPSEDAHLNGIMNISGKITDRIGVKTFNYYYGEESGTINLIDGNPYWTQSFNILNEKKDRANILFVSEDMSGNITEHKFSILIDRDGDLPLLNLVTPVEGGIYKNTLNIEGSVLDDDNVNGVYISVDGEEFIFNKTFNSFSNTVEGLKSGKHTLVIYPEDSDHIKGDKLKVSFEIDSFDPQILINSIRKNKEEKLYYPGVEVTRDGGYEILGSLTAGNGIVSVMYRIGNGDYFEIPYKKQSEGSAYTYSIKIGSNFHYGVVNYSIKVVDNYGNEIIKKSQIYVKNYTVINDEWGLRHATRSEDGKIILRADQPFKMFFNGPDIRSVIPSPQSNVLSVSHKGSVITVSAAREGFAEDIKFIVETGKGFFETEVFDFITDTGVPVITMERPGVDTSQSKILSLKGSIKDAFLEKLEYRFSNQIEYSEIKYRSDGNVMAFRTSVDIPETLSETLSVEVRATDILGNESIITRSFLISENTFEQTLTREEVTSNIGKSSDKPQLIINSPLTNSVFFNEPVISGFARDDDSIKEIRIFEAGEDSIIINTSGLFDISLSSFGKGKKTLSIVAIDSNGVESKIKKISYIYEPNISSIKSGNIFGELISYESGATIYGEILGEIKGALSYSFGDDEYSKASVTAGKYSIDLPKDLDWGQNNITIKYIDVYGRERIYRSFFYLVDGSDLIKIVDDEGIYFSDIRTFDDYIDLTGKLSFVGYFNGRRIKNIRLEAESGELPGFLTVGQIGSKIIIKSLTHGISSNIRVVVETIDGDVFRSDYYRFISDNSDPELKLETKDNIFIKSMYNLSGSVKDDIKISSISYSLNSGTTWIDLELKEPPIPVKQEKYTSTILLDDVKIKKLETKEFLFSENINFSDMKDSGYSIYLRVRDLRGNEVVKALSFVKDNTNPGLELFIPGQDEINGIISLIGKSADNIELDSISYSKDGVSFYHIGGKGVFNLNIDFGIDDIFPETFVIKSVDKAGNYTEIYPHFNINQIKDKPIVQIQTPTRGEIIRNDFIISGMAFDDDGISSIYYSLDEGELLPVVKGENNFSINIPLDSIENNEHIITVKAVDILGIESDIITSNFWVSKEEPTSALVLPKIEDTKRDTIKLVGTSFDKNGIDSVYISTDNGVSYQKAVGQEDWNYTFNTRNIKDGTYSLFVKSIDKLQTVGFYSTLINIDNTPPELIITEPVDGDILSDKIIFSGRSLDNVGLKIVKYKIYNHSASEDGGIIVSNGTLDSKGIFNIDIPLEGYDEGDYNIELIAYDMADNRSISTRNFTVTASDNAGGLEMLFPQSGSVQTSVFELSGRVLGEKTVTFVNCYIDGELFSEIKVNEFNYFNLKINTRGFQNGKHTVSLNATLDDGQIYETAEYDFIIESSGPWLTIINIKTGENISGRPFLRGESGYIYNIEPLEENIVVPVLVEVSLDNGQIFQPANGTSEWDFRIETWQYDDGLLPVLVRSTFSNGEIRTSRITINIDRTVPEVSILEDLEQGRFNNSIKISGTASDANGLTDISVILREGDKSNYEVPGLFQGMFIDAETGYGKLYGTGIGLTFFDDNVKVQATVGETRTVTEDARIKGFYYGFKLLANLYSLELGSLFGPDFDMFSMSMAIGASFTNKTLSVSDVDFIMWYSAVVGQLEFFKAKFDNAYFSSISLFLDMEATLISSETSGGFFPKFGLGTRITLF